MDGEADVYDDDDDDDDDGDAFFRYRMYRNISPAAAMRSAPIIDAHTSTDIRYLRSHAKKKSSEHVNLFPPGAPHEQHDDCRRR